MRAKSRSGDRRLLYLKGVQRNARQRMDGVELFERLPSHFAKLVICDPQYRTGLDVLKFGNEGTRQKARYRLPQMTDDMIAYFIEEAERVLKGSGHLLLWVDKFTIGSGQHLRWMRRARHLKVVDLITWNKMRPGMGRRARCVSEFLLIIQKLPIAAKGAWTDHSILDCWAEGKDSGRHPHAKPHVLIDRLIRATTKRGDIVVDPCAGGYGVLDACMLSGREFIGCDLIGEDA